MHIMDNDWKINPDHDLLLKDLFIDFDHNDKFNILDAGSGRTSLYFLTTNFKNSVINGIVYPGDERKITGINSSVKINNYVLEEVDIHKYVQKINFDIVLAHLLLGEAQKFSKKPFLTMLDSLFRIKTKYLVIVDIMNDKSIDYDLLLKYINEKGNLLKTLKNEKYIGFLIQQNLI